MRPQIIAQNMDNNKKLPQRKSPRANFHDYSGGMYFVTICTHNKKHYFGEIIDDIKLNPIGEYCKYELENLHTHYSSVVVPLFVIMPNHIHAIICIDKPLKEFSKRTTLSVVVGGFKRAITLFAKKNKITFAWQTRYHDHIIRNLHDQNIIADYIENNVARWASDCFYK